MFTLIAYRSDGDDYCRGCHMGGWRANHQLFINLNATELRDKLAELKNEKYYDDREDGYEFAILVSIEGTIYRVYGDLEYNQSYKDEDDAENYWEKISGLEDVVKNIFKDAEQIVKDKKIDEARQQKIIQAAAEERARNAKKQQELAQLAELKAKYEK